MLSDYNDGACSAFFASSAFQDREGLLQGYEGWEQAWSLPAAGFSALPIFYFSQLAASSAPSAPSAVGSIAVSAVISCKKMAGAWGS